MRRILVALFAVIVAFTAGFACGQNKTVKVVFLDGPLGFASGFACHELAMADTLAEQFNTPYYGGERILAAEGRVNLVVDFIRIGTDLECRVGSLLEWCADHECMPIAGLRRCIPLQLTAPTGTTPDAADAVAALSDALRTDLSGVTLTTDAPDEPIVLRVVATTQPCAELLQGDADSPFECSGLVGCAYSCTVIPDQAKAELSLELSVNPLCELEVTVCASTPVNLGDVFRCPLASTLRPDAGLPPDGETPDAGTPDAGTPDAG